MIVVKVADNQKSKRKTKNVKNSNLKQKTVSKKNVVLSDLRKDIDIKGDKVLEKVEKMVEKDWRSTEKYILKRKNERKDDNYKDVNLDIMMSRILEESKKQKNGGILAGKFLYFVYFLIIVLILIFVAKWLFVSQNG